MNQISNWSDVRIQAEGICNVGNAVMVGTEPHS